MKKLVLTGLVLASSMYAIDFNGIEETYKNQIQHCWRWCQKNHDKVTTNFINNNDVCFNASDIIDNTGSITDNSTITTKIAGQKFYLKITKKPECDVDEVKYQLIDNKTGNVISEANITNPLAIQYVDFNIPNSYKDVAIKFIYDKAIDVEENCTTNPHSINFSIGASCNVSREAVNGNFHFKVNFSGGHKCFNFSKYPHNIIHFHHKPHRVSCSDPFKFDFSTTIDSASASFRIAIPDHFQCYKVTVENNNIQVLEDKVNLAQKEYDDISYYDTTKKAEAKLALENAKAELTLAKTKINNVINTFTSKTDDKSIFEYMSDTTFEKEPIDCSAIPEDMKDRIMSKCSIVNNKISCTHHTVDLDHNATFYIMLPAYDCYENSLYATTEVNDTDTSDNFAIRPDKFNIALEKTNVKVNELIPFSISAIMADGNIATNYSASSTDLLVTFSNPDTYPKYSFDITNGIDPKGSLYLTKAGTTDMNVTDEDFANVDKDDTADEQRFIKGSTSSSSSSSSNTVTANGSGSKYWAGVGTNEEQNDPTKNTINSDIRQNIKKDLHFNRVNW